MDNYSSSLCRSLVSYGVVKSILNKLIKYVLDEIKSDFNPFHKDDLQKLEQTMSFISAAVPDAEVLAVSAEARDMIHELKEVAYDIEDLLDLAATQKLEQKIKVSLWRFSRPRFSPDLVFKLKKLDVLAARLKTYCSSSLVDKPGFPPTLFSRNRALTKTSHYKRLNGWDETILGWEETIRGREETIIWWDETILRREEDEERLISCILSPSTNPIVISVTGPGGIGKSTLLKQACGDSRVISSFDFVSWASYDDGLSYQDGLWRLTRKIREDLTLTRKIRASFLEQMGTEDNLCNLLRGSKFLLVVDGIKHGILSEWEKLYLELLEVSSTGSTIILIAWSSIKIGRFTKTFKLEGMPEEECWSLFKRWAAFDEDAEEADSSLRDIGRCIVIKYGGSPLAVKTLACLLRNNRDAHYWEHLHQTKLWGQCNEAWAAWCIGLKLLPVELIPCYATHSIAGNYHSSSSDELVWFWMAQGLLQSTKENDSLRDIGRRVRNELESMNFLPFGTPDCLLGRHFIECLSGEQIGHVNEEKYLPYKFKKDSLETPSKARTFWLTRSRYHLNVNNQPFLEGLISNLKYLRVLLFDHSGLEEFPESIGNLQLLRYLSLAGNRRLQVLPNSICKLMNLQTLDLSKCKTLITLPQNIHKLACLRHLLLSGNLNSLAEQTLKSWTSLHHLKICHVPDLELSEMGFKKLTTLRTLQIHDCYSIVSLPNSINRLTSLEELSIRNCQALDLIGWEGLLNLRSLKSLRIEWLPKLFKFPDGLQTAAASLEHLVISSCENLDLTGWNGLLYLRSLRSLYIKRLHKLLKLPDGLQSAAGSLEHLLISECENFDFTGSEGLLNSRSLKSLVLEWLPKLSKLPDGLQSAADSLEQLVIRYCKNLDLAGWEGLYHLGSLKCLQIRCLPQLLELPDGLLHSAANSLEHLVINQCENLKILPESLKHCTCLVEIYISQCPRLFALPRGFHALRKLQMLSISYCPYLVERCKGENGDDWHLISHIPLIYLNGQVIRNRTTSTVNEQPGALNLSTSKENRAASAKSSSEIIPFSEKYHSSPFLSDYGYPPRQIQHHSVQSPNEHHLFSPPSKGAAEHSQLVPVRHSLQPSLLSDMNTDVQAALFPGTHHLHDSVTGLESRGASSNDDSIEIPVLELEKELEGRRLLFLFENGYEFEKEVLIQLWMALGILTDEPMEVIGAKYFEKLVYEGYISCSGSNSLYKVNAGKMKVKLDMIRDEKNCVTLGNGSRCDIASAGALQVSVICEAIDDSVFTTLRRFKRLRILLFLRNYGSRLKEVPRDLFLCYESLVALDLSGAHIKELPSSIEKMIHLRFLDLSWTLIEVLPERMDHFPELQTLKLKGCSRLHRLPKEMKGLTKLRHLDLDVLGQLATFPEGIGALVSLQTLSAFPVGIEEGLKISELKCLDNLTGEFCISKLENVQSVEEAKGASMTTKRSIKKLELRWSDHQFQETKNEDEAIIENLCPCSELEEIKILCYPGTRFPGWITHVSFHKLVSVTLFRCVHVSVLPSLEKLPAIVSLELISLNSVANVNFKGEVGNVAFSKLQKLTVDEMLNVESWAEAEEGDYPCLVEVNIRDCPNLPELPSLVYLPSIKHLEVSGCTNLALASEEKLSTSLQQLIVEDCPLLEKRCSKDGGQDWHKIQHVPTIWIDQVAIQTNEEDLIDDNDDGNDYDDDFDEEEEDDDDESYYWDVFE